MRPRKSSIFLPWSEKETQQESGDQATGPLMSLPPKSRSCFRLDGSNNIGRFSGEVNDIHRPLGDQAGLLPLAITVRWPVSILVTMIFPCREKTTLRESGDQPILSLPPISLSGGCDSRNTLLGVPKTTYCSPVAGASGRWLIASSATRDPSGDNAKAYGVLSKPVHVVTVLPAVLRTIKDGSSGFQSGHKTCQTDVLQIRFVSSSGPVGHR